MRITLPSGTAAEIAGEPGGSFGLVLLPDIMGLRPLFDDHVARLHEQLDAPVIAIEPWPGRESMPLDQKLQSVGTIADEQLLGDAVAAADHLGCDRTGVLGFCMGGMFVFKAAATERFDRGVAFYGMIHVPEDWRSDVQGDPVEALQGRADYSVLAIIGDADVWTPPDHVAELEALPNVTVVRYAGAEHGFVHDPDRPAHRAEDAADAWQRAVDFLRG